MKVVWFCNRPILDTRVRESGSWMNAMALDLKKHRDIQIIVISESSSLKEIVYSVDGSISQYLLPKYKRCRNGLPKDKHIDAIKKIICDTSPDIIHVWGVENYWGLLFSRGYIKHQYLLLDMQGVLHACSEFYLGNLHFGDFCEVMPFFKALYSYSFVTLQKYRMYKRTNMEREIISHFPNISYQSEWVKDWVKYYNEKSLLFKTLISVRTQYKEAKKWNPGNYVNNIILVTSPQAYKRIDIAIKALSIVCRTYDSNLIVVGDMGSFWKGYPLYIECLIKKLQLEGRVKFVGPKNADEIIVLSKDCVCAIVPSAVESYSLVLAEFLTLGVPVVASYAGAMPEFSAISDTIKFFPSGDFVKAARCVNDFIESRENKYNEIEHTSTSHRQVEIYNAILSTKL